QHNVFDSSRSRGRSFVLGRLGARSLCNGISIAHALPSMLWDATGTEDCVMKRPSYSATVPLRSIWAPHGPARAKARTYGVWCAKSAVPISVLGIALMVGTACFAEPGQAPAAATRPVLTLRGHGDGIFCVAFNRDGNCLASASRDRTLRLWDTTTGKLLRTLKGHDNQVLR